MSKTEIILPTPDPELRSYLYGNGPPSHLRSKIKSAIDKLPNQSSGVVKNYNYRIKGRVWLFGARHCGQRMCRVDVLYPSDEQYCSKHNNKVIMRIRVCACPNCDYAEVLYGSGNYKCWAVISPRGRPTSRPPLKHGEGSKPNTSPPEFTRKPIKLTGYQPQPSQAPEGQNPPSSGSNVMPKKKSTWSRDS